MGLPYSPRRDAQGGSGRLEATKPPAGMQEPAGGFYQATKSGKFQNADCTVDDRLRVLEDSDPGIDLRQ